MPPWAIMPKSATAMQALKAALENSRRFTSGAGVRFWCRRKSQIIVAPKRPITRLRIEMPSAAASFTA